MSRSFREQKTNHKIWITKNTEKKLEERKELKSKLNNSKTLEEKIEAQANYTKKNKEVKQSIRNDKRENIEKIAQQAETAASKGNMRELYMLTKKMVGKFQQPNKPIKDKEGKIIKTTEDN